MFDIRQATIKASETTQDPLAANKLNEAYSAVTRLAKTLTAVADKDEVVAITTRLLQDFTDAELDKSNPDLILALCSCLSEALVRYGRSLGE